MRKREIEEPKRLVADCTEAMHNKIKIHCARKGTDMKEFLISAVEEKYEREKEV